MTEPDHDRDGVMAELVTRDGELVQFRPLVPHDEPAYRAFAEGLSPESIYYRFFSPRSRLTEHEIDHFLHVDYVDRFAIAAVVGDRIVGIGRYDRTGAAALDLGTSRRDAEVAFVVADDYQGNGIATELLRSLARAARPHGIDRFVAAVLPDNRRMLQVFADSGWVVDRHFEDGVMQIALAITRGGGEAASPSP